ncbi:MAG: FAD-dependent oxidoreductase [Coriobacteriales bacterium]|nr:FAD-dependent oxidoreductase [Coriobacteriales bacterium]
METEYDVIVIGAGNGGNAGALTLQKAGKKTLLLEQHDITGGCGSSFVRGRFEFETGLHQLYGVGDIYTGEKGYLRRLFETLGVWDKIEFVPQEEAFRLAFKGMGEIALPNTREGFVGELQDFFNTEKEAIAQYQDLVERTGLEFMRLYDFVAEDRPITQEEFPCLFEYGQVTGLEMLNKYFENAMLKGVYQCLYGYLGIPIERIPFPILAALYERTGGSWNVKGTSASMTAAVTNTFIDLGGTLKLNTRVKKIIVEDNIVKGVETESGETFHAPVVLCNVGRINAYIDLIDNDLVPEDLYADLRVSNPSQGIFGMNIGLDCTAEEVGLENATSFLMPAPGTMKPQRYEYNLRQLDYVPLEYVSVYNIDDPDYSEEGTCVLTVLTSKVTDPFVEYPPEQYHDVKFKYAEKMLDYFYDFYPEVKDHIEEIEIFTPMTLQRYIGSINGGIYGVDSHMKDLIASKLDARSPIGGLYFCGASFMFGGFHTTFMGGYTAARVVLKDMREGVHPVRHDFSKMKHYDKIMAELEVGRTYNFDHRVRKGKVRNEVNTLHPDSIKLKVVAIRTETASAKSIKLAPVDGYIPPFVAGQYLNLSVCVKGIHTSRAYSISSPETERGFYEITVRESKDGFVSDFLLNDLKVGDVLTSTGPLGTFYRFRPVHGRKLCFIAGGSGITPFMSMLETDSEKFSDDEEIVLLYGCAKEDDVIFVDRLEKLAAVRENFRLVPVISEPEVDMASHVRTGFITAELIKEELGDPQDYTLFLCGPQAMYDFVVPELEKLEVARRKIRKEVPSAPKEPWKLAGWPQGINPDDVFTITLTDGRSLPAVAGESILFALEKAGITKKNHCRSGECGVCRSRLMDGEVFHPGLASLRKSDMRYGYIHPCVTYPAGDLTLLI